MHFNCFFSKNRQLILATLVAVTIASCSSAPKKAPEQPKSVPKEEVKPKEIVEDAQYYLTMAEQSLATNPDQTSYLLINAAQSYLSEEKPNNALWLAKQLEQNKTELTSEQQYRVTLIKAQATDILVPETNLKPMLDEANEIVTENKLPHDLAYYQLLVMHAERTSQLVLGLDAKLRAFTYNQQATDQDITALWQDFVLLTQWQQQQLQQKRAPMVTPWLKLAKLANEYGHNNQVFNNKLSNWQKQNPTHPANVIVNQLLEEITLEQLNQQPSIAPEQKVIAIILPLTGKQARAGQVAQQGILAAYQNNTDLVLNFIDANQLDFTTLNDTLIKINASRVIGPLLKEHVEQFLAQNIPLPTLLLNLPTQTALKDNQIAISMRPEDEAVQAAAQLSDKHYRKPLLLSHNDPVSQRIAQTFANQWLSITDSPIETMTYSQGKDMQNQLKQSLGVDDSERRIKDLRVRLDQILKIEERNRRDIDMIYIVGNNQQTRLIKPYIDVNIATFADVIPVYASSRSHSLNHDDSALVDLNGMTFTEMPWLLSSEQQNTPLAKQAHNLWPNRSDSLQRIFAMGYDAIELVNKLEAFKARPYVRHFGQTGVLKLNESNVLTRSLLWGQYSRSQVKQLAQLN
ncbi:penicillin-binding protein activator [Thalassotalea sp. LPB0316]|uniref:penicillin-binding protein activator n=1 Tax=Thalassotalea sp. LPB0316 TaxID=2769490 RepID=UPI001869550A|nr:penicillin-binding protein activator [Thalassotalea sp. LPB0316]QOL25976.1 penicillin-binding protein activator [Thalassotalea sp. LPB0316]